MATIGYPLGEYQVIDNNVMSGLIVFCCGNFNNIPIPLTHTFNRLWLPVAGAVCLATVTTNSEKRTAMIVTVWNNGRHHPSGAGYGVKISATDRDQCFDRRWQEIELLLEGEPKLLKINVNKASFWGETCRELISAEIGCWLMKHGLAPWKKGEPPKLELESLGSNRFQLHH